MMDLFSSIADQVRNRQELFDEEGKIMQALLNDGYHIQEADAALTLMQTLAHQEDRRVHVQSQDVSPVHMRAMNTEERGRFSVEAFSFLSKLANLGIISEDQREEALEKAMTSHTERIELEHVKSIVTYILFIGAHELEHGSSGGFRRLKKTAWN